MPVRDLLMGAAGASGTPTYVDDVFSTYLYAGTGANQTITNNIDLTKGGLVWIKSRANAYNSVLTDTVRGTNSQLISNQTVAAYNFTDAVTAFNTNGFNLGASSSIGANLSGDSLASWTFRKAPKFFDIVQYTGTGSAHAINHSLGSTPGCIIVKDTSNTNAWSVYHKGLNGGTTPEQYYAVLNTTAAQVASSALWNNTAPTSTQFTVGTDTTVNASGHTYIAYIFADQAGGFGSTGTDSAIACGSYTGTGATGNFVSLGWEPQYVMIKRTNSTGNWVIEDVLRGQSQTQSQILYANTFGAETTGGASSIVPNATGFTLTVTGTDFNVSGSNYIYIAIRRPNKPPTTGTSVYNPITYTGTGTLTNTSVPQNNFDTIFSFVKDGSAYCAVVDRLRGFSPNGASTLTPVLQTSSTNTETDNSQTDGVYALNNNNYTVGIDSHQGTFNNGEDHYVNWIFTRAPTFFDEVVYTATNATTTLAHNLTIVPEMMIVKDRTAAGGWYVYHKSLHGGVNPQQYYLALNAPNAQNATANTTVWGNTAPTSTQFTVGNLFGSTTDSIVTYLFATCSGVSKVSSYTGNGTGQSIACGFGSGGARFILIKRTDSTGDWYCYDSANGLTSSSSPYLLWDSTAAQVTGNNGVYASSGGFTLTSSANATVNINGGSYIFLAIA